MQRLGKALMLPIAVLPVAGLLLRLGQPDVLHIAVMTEAGNAIFNNLPLIFAIGIAVGFARDNNGTAALASAVGYLIQIAVMKSINAALDMGVLAGVVAGLMAGVLYNRFYNIKLPEYLAFFGGKRFVPIITAISCMLLGITFGFIWEPVQSIINQVGTWLTGAGPIGAFIYGTLNRLLIITGLHHILNSLVWFVFGSYTTATGAVITGDLHRFFAGDPTAGMFMTGFFPVVMFGLPAACLAMYHEALKPRRAAVGGMLLSMAVTAFLTGVTEPIEFTFMFLAPLLYGIHALLTGLSMAICHMLDIRLGFTFSAGAIDYGLAYGLSEHGGYLLPLGLGYALIYYTLFRFFIRRFNLATPGREKSETMDVAEETSATLLPRAQRYVHALGGASNLTTVEACTTRLRLAVVNTRLVSEEALKKLGVRGVLKLGGTSVQVIIGPEADIIAGEINNCLATPQLLLTEEWLETLGGRQNILSAIAIAATRLRIVLRDPDVVLEEKSLWPVVWVSQDTLHLICGSANLDRLSQDLNI